MLTITEALKQLKEDYDEEELDEKISEILADNFIGEEVEIQVDGGGSGPDEWYSEAYCEITDISYEDGKVWVEMHWDAPEPDEDASRSAWNRYSSLETRFTATIRDKDLGIDDSWTPEQIIEFFENLSLDKLNDLIYNNVN